MTAEFAQALRDLATFYETHPDFPLPWPLQLPEIFDGDPMHLDVYAGGDLTRYRKWRSMMGGVERLDRRATQPMVRTILSFGPVELRAVVNAQAYIDDELVQDGDRVLTMGEWLEEQDAAHELRLSQGGYGE